MTTLSNQDVQAIRAELENDLPALLKRVRKHHKCCLANTISWTDQPIDHEYRYAQTTLTPKGVELMGFELLDEGENSISMLMLYRGNGETELGLMVKRYNLLVIMPINELLDFYLHQDLLEANRIVNASVLKEISDHLKRLAIGRR